ncbi:hypothetical protein N0V90_003592 [Kalmusia sp. IMI 367209]|nr:hypothetical protein N0V90_003592 [Kalmusia sp. IMI 367209]
MNPSRRGRGTILPRLSTGHGLDSPIGAGQRSRPSTIDISRFEAADGISHVDDLSNGSGFTSPSDERALTHPVIGSAPPGSSATGISQGCMSTLQLPDTQTTSTSPFIAAQGSLKRQPSNDDGNNAQSTFARSTKRQKTEWKIQKNWNPDCWYKAEATFSDNTMKNKALKNGMSKFLDDEGIDPTQFKSRESLKDKCREVHQILIDMRLAGEAIYPGVLADKSPPAGWGPSPGSQSRPSASLRKRVRRATRATPVSDTHSSPDLRSEIKVSESTYDGSEASSDTDESLCDSHGAPAAQWPNKLPVLVARQDSATFHKARADIRKLREQATVDIHNATVEKTAYVYTIIDGSSRTKTTLPSWALFDHHNRPLLNIKAQALIRRSVGYWTQVESLRQHHGRNPPLNKAEKARFSQNRLDTINAYQTARSGLVHELSIEIDWKRNLRGREMAHKLVAEEFPLNV